MNRLFSLAAVVATLALASCASTTGAAKKECTSCCDSKAKPECCQKAAAANKECAVCKAKKQ